MSRILSRWRLAAPVHSLLCLPFRPSLTSLVIVLVFTQPYSMAQDSLSTAAGTRRSSNPESSRELDRQSSSLSRHTDPIQGLTSLELVRLALSNNAELAASRLEIDRARARLTQAGLRPNPTLDFEQQNGVANSPGERSTSVGLYLPLELGGQRGKRIDFARAAVEAAEAEVADRERRLAADVRSSYADALASLRELEVTKQLSQIDIETARVVEVRINEGDAAPLELNLLRAEVERLKAQRLLVEGRLQGALLKLRQLAGLSPTEPLTLNELSVPSSLNELPASLDAAIQLALQSRPDLKFARLAEEVAAAGYRLTKAEAAPQLTAFTRYGQNSSAFDETPIGFLQDKDRLLTFGVTITLPIFNRNQGAKAEAQLSVLQAQRRREFIESVVRAEVAAAYRRLESAERSFQAYEQSVIARSTQNVRTIRAAYEAGAFRITDLLAEQRRLIDTQREMTEALTERYRAMADVQSALGVAEKLQGGSSR